MKIQIGDEVRDMNATELEAYNLFLEDVENNKKTTEAAKAARDSALAKLTKLGLTADEIKSLYDL